MYLSKLSSDTKALYINFFITQSKTAFDKCTQKGMSKLMFLLEKGSNFAEYAISLESPSSINIQDSEGKTALFYACKKGNLRHVKQIIAAQCDIFTRDKQGHSAIGEAIRNNHFHIVTYLIEKYPLLANEFSEIDKTNLLHIAVGSKACLKIVELLVQYSSAKNCFDQWGSIPLMYVFAAEAEDCQAKFIFLFDNDSLSKDTKNTLFLLSLSSGKYEGILHFLIKHVDFEEVIYEAFSKKLQQQKEDSYSEIKISCLLMIAVSKFYFKKDKILAASYLKQAYDLSLYYYTYYMQPDYCIFHTAEEIKWIDKFTTFHKVEPHKSLQSASIVDEKTKLLKNGLTNYK